VAALTGVRVLELSSMGPVPFCGMLLGDMGADVLRIDRVDSSDNGIELDELYDLRGRNKRSARIDLKHPKGRAAFLELVKSADILLEGYRPGVTERLGIGPDDCLLVRPRLVYGRGTGWGQEGALAHTAGHDLNYIALTGALDMIGPRGGPPTPPLNLVGDYGGGALYLAFGVMCALHEARSSGKGQVVDAAMVDGVTSLLTVFHGFRQAGKLDPRRGMNVLDGGAPYYTTYETQDGKYVAVAAIEARFYAILIERLGLDAAALPSQHDRSRWPELRAVFAERFQQQTREEWVVVFDGSDACFSPVIAFEEMGHQPHNRSRHLLVDFEGLEHPAPAPRLSRTPGQLRRAPVFAGRDTVEALQDWGLSPDEISAGQSEGVFASSKVI
jgi:alpha-methylacyl-CoA racemase